MSSRIYNNYIRFLFKTFDTELEKQVLAKNLRASNVLLPVILLLCLFQLAVFNIILVNDTSINAQWKESININYAILISLTSVIYLFQLYACKSNNSLQKYLKLIPHFIYIVGFSSTISFALYDQIVTSNITVYFLALVFIPLIITLNFKFSLIYTILAQIVFLILYPKFQSIEINLINQSFAANATAVLSLVISYINWSKNIREYESNKIIKEQQDKLNNQNIELLKLNEKLNNSNSEKNKFFSILSHDLRSPIGSFKLLVDELINYYDNMDNDEKLVIITSIKNASINTYNLLEDVLVWAKSQMDDVKLNKTENDLAELIYICIELHKAAAVTKSINVEFIYDEPFHFDFDYNLIKSVVLNLLSNALKFTHIGGIVSINIHKTSQEVLVSIKDTGVGMSTPQIENLFILSKKETRVGTAGERGTGLGLILVKDSLEKHSGKLEVESTVGVGSIFTFSLPLN